MIDIHAPKVHSAAIGLIGIAVAGLGYGVIKAPLPQPIGYTVSQSDLKALPFGRHEYEVFFTAGAEDFASDLVDAIKANGDAATMEGDLNPHTGIWVSPDTLDGHKLADALSALIGEPVKVGDSGSGDMQIGIGRKMRKK
jgi:hypothetical protein